jgi:arylsulfatase A-like enzyme
MNVLMIVSDTVRQDYFGINGGPARTPNLDVLARESVYFRRAYANSFATLPARGDYLTGTYAFTGAGWGPLPRAAVTVPELLGGAGVTSVGVVDTPFYTVNGYNYDRGFTYFTYLPTQIAYWRLGTNVRSSEYDYCAPQTIVAAEKALEQLVDRRFFLLVDMWDPHEPWDPPHYYVRKYKRDYDGRVVDPVYGDWAAYGYSKEDLETAIACYCGELEMVDRWTGRLLERVESLGLAESTVVIFVSDHGFYFGEHGLLGKQIMTKPRPINFRAPTIEAVMSGESDAGRWARSPLYPEICKVPLMIRLPGVAARVENQLVSAAINIAPTILDIFGLVKPGHMRGHSLLPLVRAADLPGDEFALTAAAPFGRPGDPTRLVDDTERVLDDWQPVTFTTRDWILLFSRWADPIELYAVGAQAQQESLGPNVAADHPEIVKELHGKMIAELGRAGASEQALADRR